jgi:phosphoglycerate dehydrogenase-like enzyme
MSNVELVTLDDLLRQSDIVSVNLALDSQTENIIAGRELGLMKPNSVLINTADGKHVNTLALYRALKERQIAAAGLDVLAEWDRHNPLLSLDNVVLTPQSASWTREASANLAECVVGTVEAFAAGKPINLIN